MTIPYFDHIYYNDCLDDQNGLPYLASQVENGILPKIDIGFTDPPFNIDLQNNPNGGRKFHQTKKKDQQYYDDNLSPEDYEQWCRTWFGLLRKICRTVIIYCGNDNLAMWYRIQEPLDQIIYFTPFNTIITPTAWAGRFRPLLIYSDHYNDFLGRNDTYKLKSNVIVSEETGKKKSKYKHPCPMPYELVHSVLFDLKPKSVIDPFLGSGTIAEACYRLHVPIMYGFEKNPAWKNDLLKRIAQKDLSAFFRKNKKLCYRILGSFIDSLTEKCISPCYTDFFTINNNSDNRN